MDTLYHYCSNETFLSIIAGKKIRLSSLTLSNDSSEGSIVAQRMVDLGKQDELNEATLKKIKLAIEPLSEILDGLGFCLSGDPDLLSQWRGYAGDATGVSIGFSRSYLEEFSASTKGKETSGFNLHKVVYETEEQMERIRPIYVKVKELIDQGAFKIPEKYSLLSWLSDEEKEEEEKNIKKLNQKITLECLSLLEHLYTLKSKAFSEEKEWRLVSYHSKKGRDSCEFRVKDDRIIPYRDYCFSDSSNKPITNVVLGPKNKTPEYVINAMLEQNGFSDIDIRRSEATYR